MIRHKRRTFLLSSFILLLVVFHPVMPIPLDAKEHETERNARILPLFSVVTFSNNECTLVSDSTMKGSCYSASECRDKGGTADGNCAAGFGVCCMFSISACGGTVSRNITYISNAGFPTAITTASTTCTYNVNAVQDDICQLRLDFDNFVMPITATTGALNGGLTVTSPMGATTPTLGGTNSGEHIFVEVGRSATATPLVFTTGTGTTSRSWKVKVSQIECSNPMRAPADCLQYHTGVSGTFRSFNFGATTSLIQQSLNYGTCFRREKGNCQINYSISQTASPDPFFLESAPTSTVAETAACTLCRLSIPNSGTAISTDYFCGSQLSIVQSDTLSTTVTQFVPPFRVTTACGAASVVASTGYSLVYNQVPC